MSSTVEFDVNVCHLQTVCHHLSLHEMAFSISHGNRLSSCHLTAHDSSISAKCFRSHDSMKNDYKIPIMQFYGYFKIYYLISLGPIKSLCTPLMTHLGSRNYLDLLTLVDGFDMRTSNSVKLDD